MKQKDRPLLRCAHNPKVGGSNPSPAIERRLNKPPFSLKLPSGSAFYSEANRCSCSRFRNNWEQVSKNRSLNRRRNSLFGFIGCVRVDVRSSSNVGMAEKL